MRDADHRHADPPRRMLAPVLRCTRSRILPLRLATVSRYTGDVRTIRSARWASKATPEEPSIAAATAAATPASTDPKNACVRRMLFALLAAAALGAPAQSADNGTGAF